MAPAAGFKEVRAESGPEGNWEGATDDKSQQVIYSAGDAITVDDPRPVLELVIPVPKVVQIEAPPPHPG